MVTGAELVYEFRGPRVKTLQGWVVSLSNTHALY